MNSSFLSGVGYANDAAHIADLLRRKVAYAVRAKCECPGDELAILCFSANSLCVAWRWRRS